MNAARLLALSCVVAPAAAQLAALSGPPRASLSAKITFPVAVEANLADGSSARTTFESDLKVAVAGALSTPRPPAQAPRQPRPLWTLVRTSRIAARLSCPPGRVLAALRLGRDGYWALDGCVLDTRSPPRCAGVHRPRSLGQRPLGAGYSAAVERRKVRPGLPVRR